MAEIKSTGGGGLRYKPYVPAETDMKEFTVKALIIGLIMSVVLGAANAYLGLKAGMTIAATYPAAVIGMALLRLMKGSILEENFARTVGSIGESVAAGAIFTLPAFFIAGIWPEFATTGHYLESTAIMLAGGVLGIMFVALLRRMMVEDTELPFPESVAASEIHKAGRSGGTGAKFLFSAMGVGGVLQSLMQFKFLNATWEHFVTFVRTSISLKSSGAATGQSGMLLSSPAISPAYIGVGYIIGPKLAALNFSGGLLAWGLFVPILTYFIGPTLFPAGTTPDDATWTALAYNVWRLVVRPIAIGGMLMSAAYTLFKMRHSLITGIKRSIGDVKKAATGEATVNRIEQDLSFKSVMLGILAASIATFFIYNYFAGNVIAALTATFVMVVAGFFFAAVSGYLVGIIGSSNNPISGLTLSTLLIAALLMVALGMTGSPGVAAVLGVAGV
ncbi:MAG: oligopeptide transporter, OPT family, partial [Ignavibacteriales bacterium]|nr:oligopeptide transporter, OPT family [Ignavibacteriales bacterium]